MILREELRKKKLTSAETWKEFYDLLFALSAFLVSLVVERNLIRFSGFVAPLFLVIPKDGHSLKDYISV
jgi:hypothetical protein